MTTPLPWIRQPGTTCDSCGHWFDRAELVDDQCAECRLTPEMADLCAQAAGRLLALMNTPAETTHPVRVSGGVL